MKKEDKVQKAMEYLAIAFNLLPQDTSDFQEARNEVKKTLNKLEKSLNKRVKRKEIQATPLENWTNKLSQAVRDSVNPKRSLEALDKMLEDEKKKLADLQNDGKDQTLFG